MRPYLAGDIKRQWCDALHFQALQRGRVAGAGVHHIIAAPVAFPLRHQARGQRAAQAGAAARQLHRQGCGVVYGRRTKEHRRHAAGTLAAWLRLSNRRSATMPHAPARLWETWLLP